MSFSIKNLSDLDKFFFEIQNFESDILKDSFLFDFFENHKNNEIKIGYRFIFQSLSKTLTDKDIDKELKNFIKKNYFNRVGINSRLIATKNFIFINSFYDYNA